MVETDIWDVAIVGGGLAGLSAAIYLGRARRRTLVIDSRLSMAAWEPHVENYLGFPEAIAGEELIERGKAQAQRFNAVIVEDLISTARGEKGVFELQGKQHAYSAKRVLLATGIYHIPPEIPELDSCLGHSIFFCKDCDGYRVQNRRVAVIGRGNEAIEYALGMLTYTSSVCVLSNGRRSCWDQRHARWLDEYAIPAFDTKITGVNQSGGRITALELEGGRRLELDVVFTVRGDIVHNRLAKALGVDLDDTGEVKVDKDYNTSIPGVYAAGCVTPANCQMIIAAGQGASAAQAINRDLFEESLETHSLKRVRQEQLRNRISERELAPTEKD